MVACAGVVVASPTAVGVVVSGLAFLCCVVRGLLAVLVAVLAFGLNGSSSCGARPEGVVRWQAKEFSDIAVSVLWLVECVADRFD